MFVFAWLKLIPFNLKTRTRRWEDSDEASETSSICSERSFSSSIGGTRVTEVRVSVVIKLLTNLFLLLFSSLYCICFFVNLVLINSEPCFMIFIL
jgi:hypothetical protein